MAYSRFANGFRVVWFVVWFALCHKVIHNLEKVLFLKKSQNPSAGWVILRTVVPQSNVCIMLAVCILCYNATYFSPPFVFFFLPFPQDIQEEHKNSCWMRPEVCYEVSRRDWQYSAHFAWNVCCTTKGQI